MSTTSANSADTPLKGVTVVVTRAKAQASVLTEKLQALGATVAAVATIEIVPPADGGAALTDALARGADFDQMVVASPNGARALAAAVAESSVDPTSLPPVACVGPSTAAKLADTALTVNVVPNRAVAEGLVDAMPTGEPGQRLLLVQAEVARQVLASGLTAKGWLVERVTAYRTIDAAIDPDDRERVLAGDLVTFTSSSTVERFVRLLGIDAMPAVVASIGPITSATARDLGVRVDVEADPHTIDGLIAAIAGWAKS